MRLADALIDSGSSVDVIEVVTLIENDSAGRCNRLDNDPPISLALLELNDRTTLGIRIVESSVAILVVIDCDPCSFDRIAAICQDSCRLGLPVQIDADAPRAAGDGLVVRDRDEPAVRRNVHISGKLAVIVERRNGSFGAVMGRLED